MKKIIIVLSIVTLTVAACTRETVNSNKGGLTFLPSTKWMARPIVVQSDYYNSSNEKIGSETDTVGYSDSLAFVNAFAYLETSKAEPDSPEVTITGGYVLGQNDTTIINSISATPVTFTPKGGTSYHEWLRVQDNKLYEFSEFDGETSTGTPAKIWSTVIFTKQ